MLTIMDASFLPGFFNVLPAPGIPIHGVVGVLQQVRAGFVGESVVGMAIELSRTKNT